MSSVSAIATSDFVAAEGPNNLNGIKLEGKHAEIVAKSLALFSGKPDEDFLKNGWRDDGVFADPITETKGYAQFAPQWYGLAKIFSKSETLAYKVTKDEPNLIEYEQRQKYTVAVTGIEKTMQSRVHIELDSDQRIAVFEDRWNDKPLPEGPVAHALRLANANTVPWLVSVPKKTV